MKLDLGVATLIAAVIAALVSAGVAILNFRQNSKIRDIHVLVNDRLERALAKIEELKGQLSP